MRRSGVLSGFTEEDLRERRPKNTGAAARLAVARLPRREIWVLTVLKKRKAFDYDSRKTTKHVAAAVSKLKERKADPNQYLKVISNLRNLGLVTTQLGRSGGCWLTAAGKARVKKL